MSEDRTQMNIEKNILEKIKHNQVKMTSKHFFFFKWLTLFVTSIFFLFLSFYIFAYITFLFVDNGLMYIPVFTEEGLLNFIVEIPWTLVLLGAASIFLFSITSKTFYKIYRRPFLTFFFTILIVIMISHIIFLESGLMKRIKEEAYSRHLQLVPDKFLQFRDSQTGSFISGRVVATTTNSVVIINRRGELVDIFSNFPIESNTFSVGSNVNAYIQRVDGKFFLKSIEIIEQF